MQTSGDRGVTDQYRAALALQSIPFFGGGCAPHRLLPTNDCVRGWDSKAEQFLGDMRFLCWWTLAQRFPDGSAEAFSDWGAVHGHLLSLSPSLGVTPASQPAGWLPSASLCISRHTSTPPHESLAHLIPPWRLLLGEPGPARPSISRQLHGPASPSGPHWHGEGWQASF